MIENSKESFFLADHAKLINETPKTAKVLCSPDKITHFITDFPYPDEIKKKYPKTDFIEV